MGANQRSAVSRGDLKMKRRTSRWHTGQLAVVIAASVGLLGACGSTSSVASKASQAKTSTTKAVTITYVSWNPGTPWQQDMAAAFEREHPNIKIKTTYESYSDYLISLKADKAAGALPTVMGLQVGGMLGEYEPDLVPLNGYAARTWGPNWQSRFVKTGLNQVKITNPAGNSNFYGLPESIGSEFLTVNTAIFRKYKLTPPTTFQELIADAKVFNAHGIAELEVGGLSGWQNEDLFEEIANQTAPGQWYAAEEGKGPFDTPGLVKAMEAFRALYSDHIVEPGAAGAHFYSGTGITDWNEGKAAMAALGSWEIGAMSPTAAGSDKTPIGPYLAGIQFPQVAPGDKPVPLAGVDVALGISKDATSAQRAAGWKFIAYLTQGAGESFYVNHLIDMPAKANFDAASALKGTYPDAKAYFKFAMKMVGEGTFRYVLSSSLNTALITQLGKVSTGSASPQAALNALARAARATA